MVMSAFGVEDNRLSKAAHRGEGRGDSALGVPGRHAAGQGALRTQVTGDLKNAARGAGKAVLRHPIAAGLATAAIGSVGIEAGVKHLRRKYPLPDNYGGPGYVDEDDRMGKAAGSKPKKDRKTLKYVGAGVAGNFVGDVVGSSLGGSTGYLLGGARGMQRGLAIGSSLGGVGGLVGGVNAYSQHRQKHHMR